MNTAEDPFGGGTTEIAERPQRAEPAPTEKQMAFIERLRSERNIAPDAPIPGGATKRNASALIESLLATPKPEFLPQGDPPQGVHLLGNAFVKVQVAVNGSGRKYAKRFNDENVTWEYVGRGREFHALSEATLLSLEEAKRFGHLYGQCVKCGRTLTKESSIDAGIGPVCAEYF